MAESQAAGKELLTVWACREPAEALGAGTPTPLRSAKPRPPQPTNAVTGNQAAGIGRSSRQRIAIGRSPSWLS